MDERIDRAGWNNPAPAEREAEIARKVEDLRSNNPGVRVEAARRLGELRAGTEALLKALEDPISSVRAAAAGALGFAAAQTAAQDMEQAWLQAEVVESLLAAIDDPNDFVCSAAIHSLGRLKAEVGREQIAGCLNDPNPHIVSAAILALAHLGTPETVQILLPFLEDKNPLILGAAARAMGLLGYRPAGPVLLSTLEAALAIERSRGGEILLQRLIQALGELDVQAAVPVLVRIVENEVGLRSRAVRTLMALRADSALPALVRLLEDPSAGLRKSILNMIAELDYRAAAPLVRPLLSDPRMEIRQAALSAAVRLGDQDAQPLIRECCFHDPNPFVRVQAVHSLASLCGERAVGDLLSLAGDLNPNVRKAAVLNLGRFGKLPAEAREILHQLAGNGSTPEVAAIAQAALERVGFADEEGLPVPDPRPTVRRIPVGMDGRRKQLLSMLGEWRSALPELAREGSLEEIAQTDRELSHLIQLLSED